MYDEVETNEPYAYGIYVNDSSKTWYDENTRVVVPAPTPAPVTTSMPVVENIKKEGFKVYNNIKESLDPQLFQSNHSIIILILFICVMYIVHSFSKMNAKINSLMLLQTIMLNKEMSVECIKT
jgi:hypothetical protein